MCFGLTTSRKALVAYVSFMCFGLTTRRKALVAYVSFLSLTFYFSFSPCSLLLQGVVDVFAGFFYSCTMLFQEILCCCCRFLQIIIFHFRYTLPSKTTYQKTKKRLPSKTGLLVKMEKNKPEDLSSISWSTNPFHLYVACMYINCTTRESSWF